jgi:hypothetical protein
MPTDYLAGPTISSSGEKQSSESPIHATQTGKARLDLGVSAGRHKPKCRCFNNFRLPNTVCAQLPPIPQGPGKVELHSSAAVPTPRRALSTFVTR